MIGIIGAMHAETEGLVALMRDKTERVISGMTFVSGKIGKQDAVVATCGIGKVYAAMCAQTMILTWHPEYVINSGVAGGLAPGLSIADIIIATALVQHDMDISPLGDPIGWVSGADRIRFETDGDLREKLLAIAKDQNVPARPGVIASGDQFVADPARKQEIVKMFDASACEMEGGAIAQVCFSNNVPFAVLRAISDGDGGASDYNAFLHLAAARTVSLLTALLS